MLLKACIGVLFFIGACIAIGPEILEGCNEVPNRNLSKFDRFSINDFEFNNAKPKEVFRLRMVFKGYKPAIGISYDETDFMFGPYNNTFALYKLDSDNTNDFVIEPLVLRGDGMAFNLSKYTPIDVVLTKGLYIFKHSSPIYILNL